MKRGDGFTDPIPRSPLAKDETDTPDIVMAKGLRIGLAKGSATTEWTPLVLSILFKGRFV